MHVWAFHAVLQSTLCLTFSFFANFVGQASQKGKELGKERKEKASLVYKEETRNQLENLDENRERKRRKSNLTPSCYNKNHSELVSETMKRK